MQYEPSSDNFTELLYDFLDGALALENETRLFAALSHDAELRAEFKEQIQINAAIANDEHAFTPPSSSGEAIFARLGFAAEAGDTVAAPILASSAITSTARTLPLMLPRAGTALRRGSALVLVALLSSLLTAWLMRSSGNGYGGEVNKGDVFSRFGNHVGNSNGGNGGGEASPFQGSFAGSSPQPFVIADTVFQTIVKRVFVVQSPETPPVRFIHDTIPEATQTMQQYSSAREQHSLRLSSAITQRDSAQTPEEQPIPQTTSQTTTQAAEQHTPLPTQAAQLAGFTLGARGVISRSLIWATVPSREVFPTNAALYALYSLSSQHSIGLEVGQESFFQRYYITNSRGVEFRVEQNPTLIWGGIAYRYTMLPESTVSPFAHVVAGATQIGGLGRGMVGVNYAPDARTQFHLGAEATSLFYQSEGAWFMSPKLGVSYGVSIKF